jgi:hypothetical protein
LSWAAFDLVSVASACGRAGVRAASHFKIHAVRPDAHGSAALCADDAYVLAADEKGQVLAKWHGPLQSSEAVLHETFRRFCGNPQ